jgi:predicted cupin superfamily sugar epimerase
MKLIANGTKIVLNGQKNVKEFQNDNTVWYFLLETRHFGTRWKRQFDTKTVWHQDISAPLKKRVRHQESSVSGQIGTAFSFKQTWLPFLN